MTMRLVPDAKAAHARRMTRAVLRSAACVLVPLLTSPPMAKAQVTIDVAKITCEQFLLYKVANPDYIAMWISGYYNAKRDNTVIDVEALKAHVEKVKDYCRANMNATVMQAVQTALGVDK